MIQATTLSPRARLPLIAVAAFALGAMTAVSLPRLGLGATTPTAPIVVQQAPALAIQPTVRPSINTSSCDRGAYVTGDMAGDASPASVYAVMCGR